MKNQGKKPFVLLSFNGEDVQKSPNLGMMDSMEEAMRLHGSAEVRSVLKVDASKNNVWVLKGDPVEHLRYFKHILDRDFPNWNIARQKAKVEQE